MGRKYALLQGEDASVAAAIEDHWKPQGPSDRVPTDPVSVAVALADKLDTLVGFWAIDEKPTGSKDPYALRRAALGVVRMLLERKVRLKLMTVFGAGNPLKCYAAALKREAEFPSKHTLSWHQRSIPKEMASSLFQGILRSRKVMRIGTLQIKP